MKGSFYPSAPRFNADSNGRTRGGPIGEGIEANPKERAMNKESAFVGGLLALQFLLLPQLLLI